MIKLVPSAESAKQLNTPNPVGFSSDLYSVIYDLNEGFYKNLLSLVEESKLTKVKTMFKHALQFLLPESSKFIHVTFKINQLNAYHVRNIYRYAKKDDLFANTSFYMRDIRTKFIEAPSIKKLIASQKPKWFLDLKATEDMMQFIYQYSEIRFKTASLTPLEIVPKIKIFADESVANLKKTKKDVEVKKAYLDKQKNRQEPLFETLYMQLSVYYRAVLYLYGMELTEITKLIDAMYEQVDDDELKKHTFDDSYDYIKNFMKDLI